jgi:deoxynucleoside triphosphate triphosphohydrolase SAMHD1
VTAKDVLCVKLAGLLHDVGHGPFSHVYEQFQDYLGDQRWPPSESSAEERYSDTVHPSEIPYKGHESVSLLMLKSIFERSLGLRLNWDDLDAPLLVLPGAAAYSSSSTAAAGAVGPGGGFGRSVAHQMDDDDDDEDHNLDFSAPIKVDPVPASGKKVGYDDEEVLTTRDVLFIMECIWGKPIDEYEAMFGPGFHGRPPHKEWMYDVVCNRHSGLDVGTWGWCAEQHRWRWAGACNECNPLTLFFRMLTFSRVLRQDRLLRPRRAQGLQGRGRDRRAHDRGGRRGVGRVRRSSHVSQVQVPK